MSPETACSEVLARFEQDRALHAVPVVHDGKPIGLIERHAFLERFVRPFRKELFGRKACSQLMDASPLIVEKDISIQELSNRLAQGERRHLMEGFVLTERGRYVGLGTGQDLMREITRLQVSAARYANPLTLLPGNVPINEHIDRLLQAGIGFVACHCDLDHFKPFNDAYGYRRGDDVIQLAARILAQSCDGSCDFLGHVGGDDFILLLRNPDWASRCETAVQRFAAERTHLYSAAELERGGLVAEDRQGRAVLHPLLTLSIGAVMVEPREYPSHHEVSQAAAEAKRQAKRLGGNRLFVERRNADPAGLDHAGLAPRTRLALGQAAGATHLLGAEQRIAAQVVRRHVDGIGPPEQHLVDQQRRYAEYAARHRLLAVAPKLRLDFGRGDARVGIRHPQLRDAAPATPRGRPLACLRSTRSETAAAWHRDRRRARWPTAAAAAG